jgi:hypothetical protein
MEIALAVFSWIFSIAFVLGILSVPVSLVLEKTVKGWKGSKGEKIYRYVQYGVLGLALVTLVVTLGLMFG